MKRTRAFVERLAARLRPLYTPPMVEGAHDFLHVERMVKLGPRILGIRGLTGPLRFNIHEFTAAVWLHNLDRSSYAETARAKGTALRGLASEFLEDSPFAADARERIVDAVLRHSKKDDELGDPDLLQAVRVADKVDRFSPSGIVGAGQYLFNSLPYSPANPFVYGSTAEKDLKNVFGTFMRPLEWYAMLPSDEARALIDPRFMELFLEFLRCFGEEIARHLDVPNDAESMLKKALGSYYDRFEPSNR